MTAEVPRKSRRRFRMIPGLHAFAYVLLLASIVAPSDAAPLDPKASKCRRLVADNVVKIEDQLLKARIHCFLGKLRWVIGSSVNCMADPQILGGPGTGDLEPLDVPSGLPLRDLVSTGQQPAGLHDIGPRGQQLGSRVEAAGRLVGSRSAITCHNIGVIPQMSARYYPLCHPAAVWPFPPPVRQMGLELEITCCAGGVLSPLLANLYKHRFIKAFRKYGLDQKHGAILVNYADDFVVLCRRDAAGALATMVKAGLVTLGTWLLLLTGLSLFDRSFRPDEYVRYTLWFKQYVDRARRVRSWFEARRPASDCTPCR